MSEVAYIDIPLSQIMSEVEMIQLERHILFKQIELKDKYLAEKKTPHNEFLYQKQQLKLLLDKAVAVIQQNLEAHKIRFEIHEHEHLLNVIENYHRQSDIFEQRLANALSYPSIPEPDRQYLEKTALELESSVKTIMKQIDKVTLEAGKYTEKHEQEFMYIDAALGVCALLLGLFLTVYTIQMFRKRVTQIQDGIQNLDFSSENALKDFFNSRDSGDELSELEQELALLMERLTKEITNREQIEKQLLQLATQDKLTGAYNRHKWDEQLSLHIDLARRGNTFSLILLDIDFFKKINDEYGHQVGDLVLKNLVQHLSSELRKTDMLFRLGGEEFAILLPLQDPASAIHLAERLRKIVSENSEGDIPAYTVSLGVTGFLESDDDESLFERVDKALYQAKSSGRNQVRHI